MPRNPVRHTSFAAGQLDRKVQGRSEIDAYGVGASLMINYIAMLPGGAETRPGNWRLGAAIEAASPESNGAPIRGRLIPFQRSTLQGYILELTEFKMRIWSALTYEVIAENIDTPWSGAAIRRLMWSRQSDIMILTDAASQTQPYILANRPSGWTLTPYEFRNGPFKPVISGVSINVSGTDALTISSTADVFEPGHVGALIWARQNPDLITENGWYPGMNLNTTEVGALHAYAGRTYRLVSFVDDPDDSEIPRTGSDGPIHDDGRRSDGVALWEFVHDGGVYAKITAVNSAGQVTAQRQGDNEVPESVSTTPFWHIQAFNDVDGWPAISGIHQERVFFGGTLTQPDTLFSTESGKYDSTGGDFKSALGSGLVVDSDAVTREMANSTVDPLAWMASVDDLIVAGAGGSRRVRGPANAEPITPAGAVARGGGHIGSERGIMPIVVGDIILFVELGSHRVRGFRIADNREIDLTVLSMQLNNRGIDDWAWEATTKTLWILTRDGFLNAFVYDDEQGYQAMSPMVFADDVRIEGLSIARRSDGFEALWMIMRRETEGGFLRDICVMTRRWDDDVPLDDTCSLDLAGFFDASLVEDAQGGAPGGVDVPAVTPTLPPVALPTVLPGTNPDLDFQDTNDFINFNTADFNGFRVFLR